MKRRKRPDAPAKLLPGDERAGKLFQGRYVRVIKRKQSDSSYHLINKNLISYQGVDFVVVYVWIYLYPLDSSLSKVVEGFPASPGHSQQPSPQLDPLGSETNHLWGKRRSDYRLHIRHQYSFPNRRSPHIAMGRRQSGIDNRELIIQISTPFGM